MDKNIDLINKLKVHRIPTNTAKRVTLNRSPKDHCIENQKREEAI